MLNELTSFTNALSQQQKLSTVTLMSLIFAVLSMRTTIRPGKIQPLRHLLHNLAREVKTWFRWTQRDLTADKDLGVLEKETRWEGNLSPRPLTDASSYRYEIILAS